MRPNRNGKQSLLTSSGDGSQAIRKAVSLLRAVAGKGASDASLAQIARVENLPRSTAHRMLQCLMEEGLIERAVNGKGYRLGELAYELGAASNIDHSAAVEQWRGLLNAVARRTSVTSYLMRRSGPDAACLMKADGSGVIRVVPVEVGERRSLGLGAGSIALLAALDDGQVNAAIERLKHQWKAREHQRNEASLWEIIHEARQTGFALSHGRIASGYFGMGTVIPTNSESPRLAISIAAPNVLATESMIEQWKSAIREEIENAQGLVGMDGGRV